MPFGQRRQVKRVTGYFIRNVADNYLESTALDIHKRLRLFFCEAGETFIFIVLVNSASDSILEIGAI